VESAGGCILGNGCFVAVAVAWRSRIAKCGAGASFRFVSLPSYSWRYTSFLLFAFQCWIAWLLTMTQIGYGVGSLRETSLRFRTTSDEPSLFFRPPTPPPHLLPLAPHARAPDRRLYIPFVGYRQPIAISEVRLLKLGDLLWRRSCVQAASSRDPFARGCLISVAYPSNTNGYSSGIVVNLKPRAFETCHALPKASGSLLVVAETHNPILQAQDLCPRRSLPSARRSTRTRSASLRRPSERFRLHSACRPNPSRYQFALCTVVGEDPRSICPVQVAVALPVVSCTADLARDWKLI
jgi:hypothetical protein